VFHVTGWGQSIIQNGALTQIAAIPDPTLAVAGGDIRVPAALPNLVAEAAVCVDAGTTRAEIQSPSLRAFVNRDIEPITIGAVFGTPNDFELHGDSPVPVAPNESLNFFAQNANVAATQSTGLIWLADGAIKPMFGNIFPVRATGSAALAANTWVNTAIVFSQVLPAGSYAVVGFRARGANLLAARFFFPGQAWRPGVPAISTMAGQDPWWTRFGYPGMFGQFDNTVPPTIDCLGTVDVAQTFILDLIKVK
jgi:hypothetical protein